MVSISMIISLQDMSWDDQIKKFPQRNIFIKLCTFN